jgi:hypothetical protein
MASLGSSVPTARGKSTILEAIAWALYGAPAVRGTNDTLRSQSAEGGSKVNVALTFELGGSVYKAARTLDASGRSGSAVLEVDGRPLRSGMSEVSDAITKLLGMDYRAFFTSFFTGQKQLEFMSQMDGRQRAASDGVPHHRGGASHDRLSKHPRTGTFLRRVDYGRGYRPAGRSGHLLMHTIKACSYFGQATDCMMSPAYCDRPAWTQTRR